MACDALLSGLASLRSRPHLVRSADSRLVARARYRFQFSKTYGSAHVGFHPRSGELPATLRRTFLRPKSPAIIHSRLHVAADLFLGAARTLKRGHPPRVT